MNSTYKGSIVTLKDFWESRSASFEKDYGIRSDGVSKIAQRIAGLIDGRLVLDIGCGPGVLAELYPKKTKVIGLDFSISMLKRAKNRISQLVLGDSLNLPFRNEAFEIVTCFFVASDYSSKGNIFSEAYRVLESSGVFLFADYSPEDEHWKFRREIRPLLGDSCDICAEEENALSNKLTLTGFKVQETEFIRFNAEFRIERYVKSDSELERLQKAGPSLWERLRDCSESRKIKREFVLIISAK
jgi:ubiquinone/menaquinone biosynthesis C-methylase UbiE